MASYELKCQGCGVAFTAKSPQAKWHTPACKKRKQRELESPVDQAGEGADHEPTAESIYGRDVLDAVRRDLQTAGVLETVDGRVALYLARKSIDPDSKSPAALFTQMRQALATALAGAEAVKPPTSEPEDEVEKARRKREQKGSQAKSR